MGTQTVATDIYGQREYILLLKFVEEVVSTMSNLSCTTICKGLLKLDAIVAAC